MNRRRQLVSQHTRAAIMRQMSEAGEWSGRRKEVKIELKYNGRTVPGGVAAVSWRARIAGQWQVGTAGTVYDAIREIEERAAV
jgi:hypothetical protein